MYTWGLERAMARTIFVSLALLGLTVSLNAFAQDESRIRDLVDSLGSDELSEREHATDELIRLGENALPALGRLLQSSSDPEVKARLVLVRNRIRTDGRRLKLAAQISEGLARDRELMNELMSTHPDDTVRGIGKIFGKTIHKRGTGYEFADAVQKYAPAKQDLEAVLRDILEHIPPTDDSWMRVKVLCLQAIEERAISGLAPLVRKMLKDPDASVRAKAVSAVSQLGQDDVMADVLPGFDDMNPRVRLAAVNAVARLRATNCADKVASMTRDPNHEVRLRALETLVSFDAKDKTEHIVKMLTDEHPTIRRSALSALRSFRAVEYAEDIAKRLDDADEDVRHEALSVILALELKSCGKAVARSLGDGCTFVRYRALEVLETFGLSEHAAEVAKLLHSNEFDYIRIRSIRVLVKFKAASASADLAKMIRDVNAEVRWNALDALYRLNAREAASEISCLLEDSKDYIRVRAVEVLTSWGAREYLHLIKRMLESQNETVVMAVACALAELGEREALPKLARVIEKAEGAQLAQALLAANAVRMPKVYARLRSVHLGDREWTGMRISDISDLFEKSAGVRLRVDQPVDRTFEARLAAPEDTPLRLLALMTAASENQLALILEEDSIRVTTTAKARQFWKQWISENQ